MKRASFDDLDCSVAYTLEIIGEWWTPLILRLLSGRDPLRDFQERLGIARNVLTTRLETLVEHDILKKVPYQDNPPRFDYKLTAKGRDLWLVVAALREWGDRWELRWPSGGDGPPPHLRPRHPHRADLRRLRRGPEPVRHLARRSRRQGQHPGRRMSTGAAPPPHGGLTPDTSA